MKKKTAEKQNKKRAEKRKKLKIETQSRRMTKAKQQEAVDRANKVKEIRHYELLGLAIMFKILNGRNIDDKKDKFSPEIIGKMCKDFLNKYKVMSEKEKKEFKPLVALAERKVDSLKRYKEINKKLLQEKMEKIKNDEK